MAKIRVQAKKAAGFRERFHGDSAGRSYGSSRCRLRPRKPLLNENARIAKTCIKLWLSAKVVDDREGEAGLMKIGRFWLDDVHAGFVAQLKNARFSELF